MCRLQSQLPKRGLILGSGSDEGSGTGKGGPEILQLKSETRKD